MDNSSIRLDANSKCLPIEQCKELCQRGKYVNFSAKVLELVSRDLSGTAMKLWQFLSAESVFDSDWSVQISLNFLAAYLHRTARHVSRLISELWGKGYIEKISKPGNASIFSVRLPAAISAEFKSMKPRRKATDKNVRGQQVFSFNYINTNNSTAEQNAHTPTGASPIVVDRVEIERLEKERAAINAQINDLHASRTTKKADLDTIYEKVKELGQRETTLRVQLTRLDPQRKIVSPVNRLLSDFDKARLAQAKIPSKIQNEIVFSVKRGDLGRGSIPRGISAALKLVQSNRWETPMGMRQ